MILPERVLGRPGAHWIRSGLAIGPISVRTQASSFLAQVVGRLDPLHQGDIGIDALALDVVRVAHHGGLGHLFMATSALSTSAVPIRWPETLITSSTRPVIQ
jgi:hypothetical protein